MKKILLLLLSLPLFAVVGCNTNNPPAPEQKIQIEIHPPLPKARPQPPPPPPPPQHISPMYMSGYWDGYYGRYVSARWAFYDYREGWNLGKFDRQHNIKRFPH